MNQQFDNRQEMQPVSNDQIVFTLDLAGNIRSVNKAAEGLTGYKAAELTHLNVLDLLPGQSATDLRAMANRSIRQRFGTVFEIEITASDRRHIPLEVSLDLVRGTDGTLEFHGIAVAKNNAVSSRLRPRCLDIQFQFRAVSQLNAELQAAW